MHPHTRSTFDVWIRKLYYRGFISPGKFFENGTTLYDAMRACWKKLDVDQRQEFLGIICDTYNSAPLSQKFWRKQNILSLARFVRLEDFFKMRACYLTSKVYPSVILSLEEEEFSNIHNESDYTIDQL